MKTTDAMTTLKAADPAPSPVNGLPDALSDDLVALRDGIVLTPRGPALVPARKRSVRRAVLAGGLAFGLVSVGAGAYATYERWYAGGDQDGVTCMTTFVDPRTTTDPTVMTGGPTMSDDPVADCQRYQELSGQAPIVDPGAFQVGDFVVVAPKDQVPADISVALPRTERQIAISRLKRSLDDWVDGGNAQCFTTETGLAWVRAEADALGLADLSVSEQQLGPDTAQDEACGWFILTDTEEVLFSPNRQSDPNARKPDESVSSIVYNVREGLRERVVDQCVSLSDADAITTELFGAQHHWPTSTTLDESQPCTTVDLVVGGSMQVFLRGPAVARP